MEHVDSEAEDGRGEGGKSATLNWDIERRKSMSAATAVGGRALVHGRLSRYKFWLLGNIRPELPEHSSENG
jgi:hypothetical protein